MRLLIMEIKISQMKDSTEILLTMYVEQPVKDLVAIYKSAICTCDITNQGIYPFERINLSDRSHK